MNTNNLYKDIENLVEMVVALKSEANNNTLGFLLEHAKELDNQLLSYVELEVIKAEGQPQSITNNLLKMYSYAQAMSEVITRLEGRLQESKIRDTLVN